MEKNCFESASECKLRLHKNKREEKIVIFAQMIFYIQMSTLFIII